MVATPAVAGASEPRTHDGFQLTLGAGLGYQRSSISFDPAPQNEPDVTSRGFGFAGMLMIGGTPAPGLVVGGASWGGNFRTPTVEVDGQESDAEGDFSPNLLGPYVDYYPSPTGGLHFVGVLGLASANDGNDDTKLAMGFGFGAGAGYGTWIGDEWSLGVLLRMQYLALKAEFESTSGSVKSATLLPALLVTISYH